MKSLKNKTTLIGYLIALFMCTSISINAQYVFQLHQSSVSQVSYAIANKFSTQVSINPSEIETFFNGLYGQLGGNLEPIRPFIYSLDPPTMILNWSPTQGLNTQYYIAYQDLSDPNNTGTINTEELSHTFSTLPQRLYVFAFYAISASNSTPTVSFIIVDLDLGIIVDNDIFKPTKEKIFSNDKEQGCPNQIPLDVFTNDEFEYTTGFEWTNPCQTTNYLVIVSRENIDGDDYTTNYEVAYIKGQATSHPDTVRIASIGEPPLGNHHVGNKQYEILLTSKYFTVVFPNQDMIVNSSVDAFQCSCLPYTPPGDIRIKRLDSFNPNIQPNPVQSHALLKYDLEESGDVSIYLMDATMRKRQVVLSANHQERGPHQLEVDMQHLAPGFYYYLIQTQFQQKSIKVIKVE